MADDKPDTKPAETKPDKADVVEYIGSADIRSVSAAEWVQAGVEGQSDVVWNAANNFKVKASALSPEALEVLKKDSGFKLTA